MARGKTNKETERNPNKGAQNKENKKPSEPRTKENKLTEI